MPEAFHPNVEPEQPPLAAERAAVQAEATQARLALNEELSPEQIRTAEIQAFIAENFPECSDPLAAAAECYAEEAITADLDPDFDVTTDQPFIIEIANKYTAVEIDEVAVEETNETGDLVIQVSDERNATAVEVAETYAKLHPEADPLAIPAVGGNDLSERYEPAPETAARLAEIAETSTQALAVAENNANTDLAAARSEVQLATNRLNFEDNRANREGARAQREAARADNNEERLDDASGLVAEFDALLAGGATKKEALQTLLESSENEANKTRLARIIRSIDRLENALPGKNEAVSRLIEASSLNLMGENQAAVFADFLANAEASEDFTDEEVEQLRTVLEGSDEAIRTGTDYENAMNQTVLDEDGNEVPAHTEEDPLDFGVGLEGYTSADGQQQFMRATPEHGHGITLEVTHLSPEEKALLASYLDTWRMTEDAGASEWLLSLTNYDLHGQKIVDPIKLIEAAQVVNALYGGLAGYNGEVLRGADSEEMIRWQSQLASVKGDAARSDRNPDMTAAAMEGLGIQDANGNLDLQVLRAFGEYSRDNWFTAPDYEAVQAHLAGLFPDKVETTRSTVA